MLENRLSVLKLVFKIILIGFPIIWIILSYWIIKDSSGDTTKGFIVSIILGILGYAYFLFKNMLEKKSLEDYLETLKSKQFSNALTMGRTYYGVKRSGFKGAGGDTLTQHDEQCINNDISAYR